MDISTCSSVLPSPCHVIPLPSSGILMGLTGCSISVVRLLITLLLFSSLGRISNTVRCGAARISLQRSNVTDEKKRRRRREGEGSRAERGKGERERLDNKKRAFSSSSSQ